MRVFITVLVAVTLMEMMFAMGLRLNFIRLVDSVRKDTSLVFRAVFANYFIIPGLTLAIIFLFHIPPMVAAGLLILAVAPAAPYGPPFTAIARGNLSISVGLMVILAGLSAALAPLLLHLLLPLTSTGTNVVRIDASRLIGSLFVVQLLPLCFGLAIGQWKTTLAEKLMKPASHASKILNAMMVTTIALQQFKVIFSIGSVTLLFMLLLVIGGIITGWVLGWPGYKNRISLSVITAMRNMSLSMGIAVSSFPGTPVLSTVLAYSFIAGIGVLAFASLLRVFS